MGQVYVKASRRAKAYYRGSMIKALGLARANHSRGMNIARKAKTASSFRRGMNVANKAFNDLGYLGAGIHQKILNGTRGSRWKGASRLMSKYRVG